MTTLLYPVLTVYVLFIRLFISFLFYVWYQHIFLFINDVIMLYLYKIINQNLLRNTQIGRDSMFHCYFETCYSNTFIGDKAWQITTLPGMPRFGIPSVFVVAERRSHQYSSYVGGLKIKASTTISTILVSNLCQNRVPLYLSDWHLSICVWITSRWWWCKLLGKRGEYSASPMAPSQSQLFT